MLFYPVWRAKLISWFSGRAVANFNMVGSYSPAPTKKANGRVKMVMNDRLFFFGDYKWHFCLMSTLNQHLGNFLGQVVLFPFVMYRHVST